MSEEKSIIDKVKDLVFETETTKVVEEVKEIELMDVTTADGVVLRVESMEAGSSIVVVADDMESPANGEYTLEDGTVIKAEEGLISEVVVAEVEETEEQEMEEEVNPLEKDVADLKEAVATILEKFETLNENFSKLKDEPAEKEVKLSKKDVKVSAKADLLSGLKSFRK